MKNKTFLGIAGIVIPILLALFKIFGLPCSGLLMSVGGLITIVMVTSWFTVPKTMIPIFPNANFDKYASECKYAAANASGDDHFKPEENNALKRIIDTLIGVGISVLGIAVIFKSQHWPGATSLMTIAALLVFCAVLAIASMKLNDNNCIAHKDVKLIALVGILVSCLVCSSAFWNFIDIRQWKNYPHYVECLQKAADNPTKENVDLVNLEREKLFQSRAIDSTGKYFDYNEFADREAKANALAKNNPNSLVVSDINGLGVCDVAYLDSIKNGYVVKLDDYINTKIDDVKITDGTHIYLVTNCGGDKKQIERIVWFRKLKDVVVEEIN